MENLILAIVLLILWLVGTSVIVYAYWVGCFGKENPERAEVNENGRKINYGRVG